jgi:MoaA/NifB/PqqE/SkfB family radical SAM enzyme
MTGQEAPVPGARIDELPTRLRVCGTLALRGLLWRLRTLLGRPSPVRSLTITVTRRCNSRCIMCNIWRLRRDKDELELGEIITFLSSPSLSKLIELDLTGGEPFLRPDLPQLIDRVCALKRENLKSLKTIALATNGLLPQRTSEIVKTMLQSIDGRFDVAMVCSLDGIGECHDMVRGVPGAYRRARETIERLGELAAGSLPFRLGIKTTILPVNWEQIPSLMLFAREHGLFHVLSPVLFTAERFRNLEHQPELELLTGYGSDLMDLYTSPELGDCYYSSVVVDTLKHGGRRVPCSAGTDHFFVEGDGRIFPCPLVAVTLGHIRDTGPEDLHSSWETRNLSGKAGSFDECKWCLEPGCVRFSQTSEGFAFLRFLLGREGAQRFRKAFYGEGLFKYF